MPLWMNSLDIQIISKQIKKALFSFRDEILIAVDNEMHFGGISHHLTKAFDCANLLSATVKTKFLWNLRCN
jgi:hypothetical protein